MGVTAPQTDETSGGPDDRILPWSQVKIIAGLSRTTIWRMQRTGDFPAAVQVSPNRVGWWQSELLAWKRARTPRRLPEPRAPPEPPAPPVRRPTAPGVSASPAVKAVDSPARPVRRKRRASVPENQTAFDFGN